MDPIMNVTNEFTYYTSNGYVIKFEVDGSGIYMQNVSSSILNVEVRDIAGMIQSELILPDYTAFLFLQTLDALEALEDSEAMAVKTIEIPPDNNVRRSIIMTNAVDEMPPIIPDEYLARVDGVANSRVIYLGILETNMVNGQHSMRNYELNIEDPQFEQLKSFLYVWFEMMPKDNAYGYSANYYYEHLDEFFDY